MEADVLLDITPVWEKKYAAFKIMAAQEHLWEYYERVALQRGAQGARNSKRENEIRRSLSARFSAGDGGVAMNKPVVVRNIERAAARSDRRTGQYGVSTIHEAQGRRGLACDVYASDICGSAIAGSAVTVSLPPGDNLMIHVAVEVCQPGDMLVVVPTSPCTDGYFGELLATSLRARGVKGLIIEAGCRDVRALTEMKFPVWSRAISSQGTVKATLGSVNIPVVCAGASIDPGDVIVADDDGVCVVKRDSAAARYASVEANESKKKPRRESASRAENSGSICMACERKLADLGLQYI